MTTILSLKIYVAVIKNKNHQNLKWNLAKSKMENHPLVMATLMVGANSGAGYARLS